MAPRREIRNKNAARRVRSNVNARQPRETPTTVSVYRGPIVQPSSRRGDTLFTVGMSTVLPLASNSGATIATVISDEPLKCTGWSTYAAQYAEFRVLGMQVRYVPFYQNWGNTIAAGQSQGIFVWYPQRNAGLPPATSYAVAFDYDGAVVKSAQQPHTFQMRSSSYGEAVFFNTTVGVGGATTYGVGIFGQNFTNLTTYGNVFVDILVQFRGRVA